MDILTQTYRKVILLVALGLLCFTGVSAQPGAEPHPLEVLLASTPQTPAFPQMKANIISFVDYRALQAAGATPLADRAAYNALGATARERWQGNLLRAQAGPTSLINLLDTRIQQMPRLLGFSFFDIDAALTYGSSPFTGTLLYSADGAFSPTQTAAALIRRGYEPRTVATGGAWGRGGDGMTNLNDMEMGDPFGGDVGLASRVAVFDEHIVMNAFIWDMVFVAAEAHAGVAPAYDEAPAYSAMAQALAAPEAALLQAVIVSQQAGQNQAPLPELLTLPAYDLAAIADYHENDRQVHRVLLLYSDDTDAQAAALALPDHISAFDQGWLDRLEFELDGPHITEVGAYHLVSAQYTAPVPSLAAAGEGAPQPGVVFGFWVRAIAQGQFFPFAAETPP